MRPGDELCGVQSPKEASHGRGLGYGELFLLYKFSSVRVLVLAGGCGVGFCMTQLAVQGSTVS